MLPERRTQGVLVAPIAAGPEVPDNVQDVEVALYVKGDVVGEDGLVARDEGPGPVEQGVEEGADAFDPGILGAGGDEDLGVRVGSDEIGGEHDAGDVGHGAVVAEQLVKFGAAVGGVRWVIGGGTMGMAMIFGLEGFNPQGVCAAGCVLKFGHVVGFVAQDAECGEHGISRCARHT